MTVGAPSVGPGELTSRFVTVHGYRRCYLRAGRGPVLLLIHGIGDNARTWAPIIGELARRHTVIAPDLLGHGESDKPRGDYSVAGYACGMRDLLTVLGIERATVVGHSLGGGVAMQFAYQFPERCERLVLVATGGVGPDLHPALRAAALPGAGAVISLMGVPPVRLVGWAGLRALRLLHTALGRDAEDILHVCDSLGVPTARAAFLRTLRSVVDAHGQAITMLDRCYLAAGMPSLIVWGDRDAVIPVEHARIAHAAMPGSRLEIFPGAGHFPHHSDPARFRRVLEDFLATTRPASHSPRQWRTMLREHGREPRTTRPAGDLGAAPPPAAAARAVAEHTAAGVGAAAGSGAAGSGAAGSGAAGSGAGGSGAGGSGAAGSGAGGSGAGGSGAAGERSTGVETSTGVENATTAESPRSGMSGAGKARVGRSGSGRRQAGGNGRGGPRDPGAAVG
ncbi:Putative hydrolase [Frankia alni ACN14a]|uniref:Hydrolase n=3 Tax=Frankia TaxID=1854 RepID=Q0RD29_FRAAA|nr:Putative hydrolase [Frankia alni ACN14a]